MIYDVSHFNYKDTWIFFLHMITNYTTYSSKSNTATLNNWSRRFNYKCTNLIFIFIFFNVETLSIVSNVMIHIINIYI